MVSGLLSGFFFSEAVLEEGDAFGQPLPPKAAEVLGLLLAAHRDRSGVEEGLSGWRVRLFSNIPPGKGLSSSSTDVLSVLDVVNTFWGLPFSKEELYGFAVQVEPTDPCLSEGVLVFRQQSGRVERIIHLPPVELVYFDAAPDIFVDTLLMKREARRQQEYGRLLQRFVAASEAADYEELFCCVTESAVCNQAEVSIPGFELFRDLAEELRAGLMVAHSGTIVGLLVRPGDGEECRRRLEGVLNYSATIYTEHYV